MDVLDLAYAVLVDSAKPPPGYDSFDDWLYAPIGMEG